MVIPSDWIQDSLRERNLRAKGDTLPEITTTRTQLRTLNGLFFFLWRIASRAFAEGQSWVVVTLVGIGIGINAALISIVTAWLSDMKLGYCTTGWWLSQKFCCMEISDEGAGCQEWRNWGGIEPFRYIAYVLFAVSPGPFLLLTGSQTACKPSYPYRFHLSLFFAI